MLNHWYIAANSEDVKNKPVSCKILNEAIVLFRDQSGNISALVDRCPHRNVLLSKGKVVNGNIQCPYHGWEFNNQGKCVNIPSLVNTDKIPSSACTNSYPVIEQDSYIWVWIGNRNPEEHEKPFKIANYKAEGWGNKKIYAQLNNNIDNVIENFIDTTHTGYIHAGLFRTPGDNLARNHIEVVSDGIIIDIEEQQTESLLGNFLSGDKNKQTHQDRFIMPSIVQVTYTFGKSRKMVGYHIFTPVDEFTTKLYLLFTYKFGILNAMIKLFSPLMSGIILKQDKSILDNQGKVVKQFGEHFVSTPADTANVWIRNFKQKVKNGESNTQKSRDIDFKL